jgi:hypothetical protein
MSVIPEDVLKNPNFNLEKYLEDNAEYISHLLGFELYICIDLIFFAFHNRIMCVQCL